MALINCPECGKEVSDKAQSCPNCGNSLNVKSEEFLCCPKCRNKDLHTEQKGFSGGKALVGAVLTGGIGLLAGTIGSKDIQITCLKCGHKFKAGEALTIKSDDYNKPLTEEQIVEIEEQMVEKIKNGSIIEPSLYYQVIKICGEAEYHQYVRSLCDKYNIDLKKNGSGCMSIIALIILTTPMLLFLLN